MKITVTVAKSAITQGYAPGETSIDLDLATLPADVRAVLPELVAQHSGIWYLCNGGVSYRVEVGSPTADGVVEAVRNITADRAQREARAEANWKTGVDNLLTAENRLTVPYVDGLGAVDAELRKNSSTYRRDELQALATLRSEAQARVEREKIAALMADANKIMEKARAGALECTSEYLFPHLSAALPIVREANDIVKNNLAAAKAAKAAARNAWLAANGGRGILAKMAAGYDCAGAVKALVRSLIVAKLAALYPGLRVLDAGDECTECKDRSCPSDAAFAVEVATKSAGYGAEVVWATWSADDTGDDESTQAELVRVFIPSPWDLTETTYLTLEVTSPEFNN